MLEKEKEKTWKTWKNKISKKPRKIVFLGWLWRKLVFFVKMSFFRKIGKHYLCSEGQQKVRIFAATICFWKMVLFLVPIQSHQTHRGKPKKSTFGCKSAIFGFSLEKGFYYLWYLKALLCWKHDFYSVFSKTQLCRHERMQLEKKQNFTKNRGCLPKCKKVFFWHVFFFLLFGGFVFLLPVFLWLCFVKRPKKAIFLQF